MRLGVTVIRDPASPSLLAPQMLRFFDHSTRLCDGLSRRECLRVGGLSLAGLSLQQLLQAREKSSVERRTGTAKSVIVLFVSGGFPQHESFDPKEVYIDFSRGQKVGAIRFDSPSDKVKELAEKLKSGDIRIKGLAVESADVLDGEEEKTYWENFKDFKRKQMKHQAASNSRGGGRPKRGRHSRR